MSMFSMFIMVVVNIITVVMRVAENNGAGNIDHETDDGDGNRLRVVNRLRDEEPLHRRRNHERGNSQQNDCTGKSGKYFDFPGAERKALIACVPPRCGIRKGTQPDGNRV